MENKKRYVRFVPPKAVAQELRLYGTYFTDKSSKKYQPFLDLDDEKKAWLEYVAVRDAPIKDNALIKKLESALFERYYVFTVYASVCSYRTANYDLTDVVQEASDGVIECMRRFDPNRETNANFVTVAIWWINQRIYRGKQTQVGDSLFILPVYFLQKLYRGERIADVDSISDEAFYDQTGITKKTYKFYKTRCFGYTSLDTPMVEDGDSLGDCINSERAGYRFDEGVESLISDELNEVLLTAMRERLPEKYMKIMCMRFGLDGYFPMTLEEVGDMIGVTRERVRQIQVKSLRALLNSKRIQRFSYLCAS